MTDDIARNNYPDARKSRECLTATHENTVTYRTVCIVNVEGALPFLRTAITFLGAAPKTSGWQSQLRWQRVTPYVH